MPVSMRRVNQLLALASVGAAAIGVVAPGKMSGDQSASDGERYFARMYAARAIPLGIGVVWAMERDDTHAARILLTIAGATQMGDAIIGASRGETGQIIVPGIAAFAHLLSSRRT